MHTSPPIKRQSSIPSDPTQNTTQAAYPRLPPLLRLHNELLDFCDLLAPTRAELQDRQRVAKISSDAVRQSVSLSVYQSTSPPLSYGKNPYPPNPSLQVKALWPHFDVQVFGSEATKVRPTLLFLSMPINAGLPLQDMTPTPHISQTDRQTPSHPPPSKIDQVFLPDSDIDMVVLPPQELPVHEVRANLYKLADVRTVVLECLIKVLSSSIIIIGRKQQQQQEAIVRQAGRQASIYLSQQA